MKDVSYVDKAKAGERTVSVSANLSVFGLLPGLLQALPTTLWIMFADGLGSLLGGLLAWARVWRTFC